MAATPFGSCKCLWWLSDIQTTFKRKSSISGIQIGTKAVSTIFKRKISNRELIVGVASYGRSDNCRLLVKLVIKNKRNSWAEGGLLSSPKSVPLFTYFKTWFFKITGVHSALLWKHILYTVMCIYRRENIKRQENFNLFVTWVAKKDSWERMQYEIYQGTVQVWE